MQNGDFSHISQEGVLAHQSTKDIIKTLIPQLMAQKDDSQKDLEEEGDDKSNCRKRIKLGAAEPL
jgi:hypothetical protein